MGSLLLGVRRIQLPDKCTIMHGPDTGPNARFFNRFYDWIYCWLAFLTVSSVSSQSLCGFSNFGIRSTPATVHYIKIWICTQIDIANHTHLGKITKMGKLRLIYFFRIWAPLDRKLRISISEKKRPNISSTTQMLSDILFNLVSLSPDSRAFHRLRTIIVTDRTNSFFLLFFFIYQKPQPVRCSCRLNAMNMINFGQIFIVLFFSDES